MPDLPALTLPHILLQLVIPKRSPSLDLEAPTLRTEHFGSRDSKRWALSLENSFVEEEGGLKIGETGTTEQSTTATMCLQTAHLVTTNSIRSVAWSMSP